MADDEGDVVGRYLTLGLAMGRHVDGADPARFERLVTEQLTPVDLAARGEAPRCSGGGNRGHSPDFPHQNGPS